MGDGLIYNNNVFVLHSQETAISHLKLILFRKEITYGVECIEKPTKFRHIFILFISPKSAGRQSN